MKVKTHRLKYFEQEPMKAKYYKHTRNKNCYISIDISEFQKGPTHTPEIRLFNLETSACWRYDSTFGKDPQLFVELSYVELENES